MEYKKRYKEIEREFQQFQEPFSQLQKMMTYYECAIYEIKTKLDVLNKEFMTTQARNPIESIKTRVKTPRSIIEKMERKGLEFSMDALEQNIYDIAGVRVICAFIDDIYKIADMLTCQDDITVLQVKDYIKNPKPNGYRSLHLVVKTPIFLSTGKKEMTVEIQIRTIAMNFWASLEHDIHYKKGNSNDEAVNKLTECANLIYETDMTMMGIRKEMLDESK